MQSLQLILALILTTLACALPTAVIQSQAAIEAPTLSPTSNLTTSGTIRTRVIESRDGLGHQSPMWYIVFVIGIIVAIVGILYLIFRLGCCLWDIKVDRDLDRRLASARAQNAGGHVYHPRGDVERGSAATGATAAHQEPGTQTQQDHNAEQGQQTRFTFANMFWGAVWIRALRVAMFSCNRMSRN